MLTWQILFEPFCLLIVTFAKITVTVLNKFDGKLFVPIADSGFANSKILAHFIQ